MALTNKMNGLTTREIQEQEEIQPLARKISNQMSEIEELTELNLTLNNENKKLQEEMIVIKNQIQEVQSENQELQILVKEANDNNKLSIVTSHEEKIKDLKNQIHELNNAKLRQKKATKIDKDYYRSKSNAFRMLLLGSVGVNTVVIAYITLLNRYIIKWYLNVIKSSISHMCAFYDVATRRISQQIAGLKDVLSIQEESIDFISELLVISSLFVLTYIVAKSIKKAKSHYKFTKGSNPEKKVKIIAIISNLIVVLHLYLLQTV